MRESIWLASASSSKSLPESSTETEARPDSLGTTLAAYKPLRPRTGFAVQIVPSDGACRGAVRRELVESLSSHSGVLLCPHAVPATGKMYIWRFFLKHAWVRLTRKRTAKAQGWHPRTKHSHSDIFNPLFELDINNKKLQACCQCKLSMLIS